jgi:hypothetical protein
MGKLDIRAGIGPVAIVQATTAKINRAIRKEAWKVESTEASDRSSSL